MSEAAFSQQGNDNKKREKYINIKAKFKNLV
jgi:hypothetical protein